MPTVHRTSITYTDCVPLDAIDGGCLITPSAKALPTRDSGSVCWPCGKTCPLST